MSRLVDIDDERFWDVLFDEACVEGKQSERIKDELGKIVVFDVEKVVEKLESEKIIQYGLHTEETDIMKIDDAIDIVKKGGVK